MASTINSTAMNEFVNRSTAIIVIETSTLLLLSLSAIGGNLLVVISMYRNPPLRTVTNYFVVSLAINDILSQVTVMPLVASWFGSSRFVFSLTACTYQAFMVQSHGTISVLTISTMAINRYICVCKPGKYKKIFSKKISMAIIGTTWGYSFAVTGLVYKSGINSFNSIFDPQKIVCQLKGTDPSSVASAKIYKNIGVLTPFVIIVICYFKVFKKIREHKKNIAPSQSGQNSLCTSPQEIKITWVVFAVVMGYILTWFPFIFIAIIFSIKKFDVPRQVALILTYAGPCSNAINPLIYGVLNPAFRKEFAIILRCRQ